MVSEATATMESRASGAQPNPPAKVKDLQRTINVARPERLLSAIGGGALALYGLQRGSVGGLALAALGGMFVYRGVTGHCDVYESIGIDTARSKRGAQGHSEEVWERGIKVEKEILVRRSPEELYRFWRNLDNLPLFMRHLKSVTMVGDRLSHWVAEGPAGSSIKWSAEIINDIPNDLIAWKSLPDADVDSAGSVHFETAPDGSGTRIRVSLQYRPPAGAVGARIAKLFGEAPEQQIDQDLACFKDKVERGEIYIPESVGRM